MNENLNIPSEADPSEAQSTTKVTKTLTTLLFASLALNLIFALVIFFKPTPQNEQPTAAAQPQEASQPSTNTIVTSWVPYTFEGVSFKYPSNWTLDPDPPSHELQITSDYNSDNPPYINIYRIPNPDNLTVPEYQAEEETGIYELYTVQRGGETLTAEEIEFSGITGYYLGNTGCEPVDCERFTFNYNGYLYLVKFIYPQGSKIEPLSQIFQEYISTFSLEPYQISDNTILFQEGIQPQNTQGAVIPGTPWANLVATLPTGATIPTPGQIQFNSATYKHSLTKEGAWIDDSGTNPEKTYNQINLDNGITVTAGGTDTQVTELILSGVRDEPYSSRGIWITKTSPDSTFNQQDLQFWTTIIETLQIIPDPQ